MWKQFDGACDEVNKINKHAKLLRKAPNILYIIRQIIKITAYEGLIFWKGENKNFINIFDEGALGNHITKFYNF